MKSSESSSISASSRLNAAIVIAAVLVGGWLRFYDLGASDMTADEAPSWVSASASTLGDVVRQGLQLNPGKLALHDIALHFWMLAFGDSVTSIRTLSALLGTLAIVLVFIVTRELFAGEDGIAVPLFASDSSTIAALSALVFALNVVAIRYSREGRMYALMLDAVLLQVWFYLRAVRRGGFVNYLGMALFSVVAVATSFVAGLVFLAEGLCLLIALRPGFHRWPYSWNVAVALLVAGAVLVVSIPWHQLVEKASFFSWIGPGFLTEYVLGFFWSAVQTPVLAVTLLLALWGAIRGSRKFPEAVAFTLAWLVVPLLPLALWLGPIMLLAVTVYSWTPVFAHRWEFTCIVPLCILIGLGIREIPGSVARMAILGLVVALAGLRIHSYDPNSGDMEWGVQWRAVTEAALPELKAGQPVQVVPGYPIYVIRYYSRNDHVDPALLSPDSRGAQMLVLADSAESLLPGELKMLRRRYFLQRARLRGATVLATPMAVGQSLEGVPQAQ
jgi:hypothetical protein